MRIIPYLVLYVFMLPACNDSDKLDKTTEINFGPLKLDTNISDSLIKTQGIDSYTGIIIRNKKDTFYLEFGKKNIVYNLYDSPPKAYPIQTKETVQEFIGKLPSPEEVIFSSTPEIDNMQDVFQKNYFMYDTINDVLVKIVQPKEIGNGKTGLYIPILADSMSFSIYAKNLDSTNHREALKMFRSIRVKKN